MSQSNFCTFHVGQLYLGVEVLQVQEVLKAQQMTPVPLSDDTVRGLMNLRGQIVTAFDLRRRLGLGDRTDGIPAMNVVVRTPEGPVSLLVDEIGDVPLPLQVKLLRVLQNREVVPVGSTQPMPVNVRILAATHRDLRALIETNQFRSDLYYRLAVLKLVVPPLRERRDDIADLAVLFAGRHGAMAGQTVTLTPEVVEWLQIQPWCGNVRELESAVTRLVLLSANNPVTMADVEALADRVLDYPAIATTRHQEIPGGPGQAGMVEHPKAAEGDLLTQVGPPMPLAKLERLTIIATLERCSGNRSATAKALGIKRTTLVEKLRRLGLGQERNSKGE